MWKVPAATIEFVVANYVPDKIQWIAEQSGLSESTVTSIASREGVAHPRGEYLTREYRQQIAHHIQTVSFCWTNADIAAHFGATVGAVKQIKNEHGIKKLSLSDWDGVFRECSKRSKGDLAAAREYLLSLYSQEHDQMLQYFSDDAIKSKMRRSCLRYR